MKAGGGAKRNASFEQGVQPREWQQPPGTVTLRNSVEILTKLYTELGQQEGEANCGTKAQFGAIA